MAFLADIENVINRERLSPARLFFAEKLSQSFLVIDES